MVTSISTTNHSTRKGIMGFLSYIWLLYRAATSKIPVGDNRMYETKRRSNSSICPIFYPYSRQWLKKVHTHTHTHTIKTVSRWYWLCYDNTWKDREMSKVYHTRPQLGTQ